MHVGSCSSSNRRKTQGPDFVRDSCNAMLACTDPHPLYRKHCRGAGGIVKLFENTCGSVDVSGLCGGT